MIKIKTQVFYLPILYRYITTYTSSPAQLHSELVRYSPPLETVQKWASTLFPQVKKNHRVLCARQYWYQITIKISLIDDSSGAKKI